MRNQKITKGFRLKMSEIGKTRQKKLWSDPIYRSKMVKSHTGLKQSKETIQKRVDNYLLGHKVSRATRLKMGDSKRCGKNHMWKGDKVGYTSLHQWLYRKLGQPNKCEHCGKNKKCDWANKSGKYKRIVSDWIRLCRKCHIKFDKK